MSLTPAEIGLLNSPLQPFYLPTKSSYLNFYPLEVVSRYRDPQLQVGENYSQYLFNLWPNSLTQILMFKHPFLPQ